MEMEMESHHEEAVSAQNHGQSLWRVPLSARCELHSHLLAEQAQACGCLTKAEWWEGPMAPIVTTDGRHPFSRGHVGRAFRDSLQHKGKSQRQR